MSGELPIEVPRRVGVQPAFDALDVVGEAVFWVESRPHSGGVSTLVRWRRADGRRDVTPAGFDVASSIHAYGGGVYASSSLGTWCVRDGHSLYRIGARGEVQPIGTWPPARHVEYGDLTVVGGELLCVREEASRPGAGDSLLAIPVAGNGVERVLTRAPAGFLAAPRAGPGRLAWLQWDGDQMPWDACELWVAQYQPGGPLGRRVVVAGGPSESVVEPRWGPDGDLYFVSDRTGWRNLYRWDGSQVQTVAPMAAECAAEPWELGYSSYAFLPDGRIVVAVQEGPRHSLAVIDPGGGVERIDTPYASLKPYVAALGGAVAVIASSPVDMPQVVVVPIDPANRRIELLADAHAPQFEATAISVPQQMAVRSGGRHVSVLLYAPTGAGRDWQAPLIVRVHPGPNASSTLRLDPQVQFFTSRGFAVVDVDYAGSAGYGRAFRQSLYGRWGIEDVADCEAVAGHLLGAGRAVPGQVFIRGASAGGYTALKAISADTPFAAATAVSAIVDPARWAHRAPRFQRAHATRLASSAGAVRAQAIRRPVLLVHGEDDPVAPSDEIEALATELRERALLHDLLILDGGGHQVARSVSAQAALEAELALYRSVVRGTR